MKKLILLAFFAFFSLNLSEAASKGETDQEKLPRILELLPDFLLPIAVEPKIPENFVALQESNDPFGWTYWGPREALEAYFKDESSLKESIIRFKPSVNLAQTGPNEFGGNTEQAIEQVRTRYPQDFSYITTSWGSYPVVAISVQTEEQKVFTAWVGLNHKESGWTLLFNLIYPQKEGKPSEQDFKLWDEFITKTTQLENRDFYRALGQDMYPGYTIVTVAGVSLKMEAEKRDKDGALQIVVTPLSSDVSYKYFDMYETIMGGEWKKNSLLLKVFGTIQKKQENNSTNIDCISSILVKNVAEFSRKKESHSKRKKQSLIFQKFYR